MSEKENGTAEQMNVTPVSAPVFVLSKLIPYWIIGLLDLTVAMAIAWVVYGLTPAGSLGAIFCAALLFVFVMSGIGIVIANASERMSQAMFVMLFVVLVFVLMSGLLTPISSMPLWAQRLAAFLPPRYFIEIMRCIYLKATPMGAMAWHYVALGIFAVCAVGFAALTYRKQR